MVKRIQRKQIYIALFLSIFAAIVLQRIYAAPWRSPPASKISDNALREAVKQFVFTAKPKVERPLAIFGRKLFFDPSFSANGKVSCASCHQPELAFSDGKKTAFGIAQVEKNTPTLGNVFASSWFFWDGRADSLAAQALGPIESAKEHGINRSVVAQILRAHYLHEYESLFGPWPDETETFPAIRGSGVKALATPLISYTLATIGNFSELSALLFVAQKNGRSPVSELAQRVEKLQHRDHDGKIFSHTTNQIFANFGKALAAYETTLVAWDSPFDRFAERLASTDSVESALSSEFDATALRGLKIFLDSGKCTLCHNGPTFTDQQFHNIGLASADGTDSTMDLGRALGILQVKNDPFNCLGGYLPETSMESCRELSFLDEENIEMVGAFKTPTLRNVALTAPYGHDGRFAHLREVLDHYNELEAKPAVGHREESLLPLRLNEKSLDDLEAFLKSLTSPVKEL